MAKAQKQELAVIDFTQFSVAQLPELKGKKEEIASIIEANPIVEIVDNATYESAKKSRTAVKTLRTGLEKEQKDVKKKIKEHVLDVVDREYDTLVLGVKTAEQSRQEPIDVWEEKKEQERQEKARLEQERIDGIKAKINEFRDTWSQAFDLIKFENLEECEAKFTESLELVNGARSEFQEFEVLFDRVVGDLLGKFTDKTKILTEQEQIRIDNLLIQEKNAEQSRIQEWQRTWNANIDSLTFNDITDVKSTLVKSKLVDLKHYNSGYEEIYLSTEKRLHSQIEFVSKTEEQRIAQEKFDQEKKKFGEQQAEVKFQGRVKELTDLGFAPYGHNGYILFDGIVFTESQLRTFEDSQYEASINYFKEKIEESRTIKNPIEEVEVVAEEVVAEEVVELPALHKIEESANKDAQEVEFEEKNVSYISPEQSENYAKEMLYQGTYKNLSETVASFELVFAIIDLPKFEHLKIKELLEPYNVPTLKQ